MSINFTNLPAEWNKEGTEPSSTIKTNGFAAGDKPPAAWFNWQWNKTYKAIDEIQDTLQNLELDDYVPITRKINNKALSSDITITSSDLGLENAVHTANDTTAPSTETPIDADLLDGHAASYFATADSAATAETYTATLSTTWTGSSAPYTQTVTVTGITSSDTPIVDVVLSTTTSTALNQLEAWGCVSKITTGTNQITVTCLEDKPITAIPIQLKVVR